MVKVCMCKNKEVVNPLDSLFASLQEEAGEVIDKITDLSLEGKGKSAEVAWYEGALNKLNMVIGELDKIR